MCSQCSFTSQFQSALLMHRQLHHGTQADEFLDEPDTPKNVANKSATVPRSFDMSFGSRSEGIRLGSRTTSATRLFDKLRARICRTKTLLSHPEENSIDVNNLSASSECTSKAFRSDSAVSKLVTVTLKGEQKETYGCHLCTFKADRITVLDRHLLNDHNIGLENLLKLVMAKTKDGVSEETSADMDASVRPYYKAEGETDGEFVIKTVSPTVKILKHAATNTEIQWNDIPDLKKNCRMISHELEKLINHPVDNNDEMLAKMQYLNECMCKFMDSSKTLTRVLTDQFDGVSKNRQLNEDMFDLELGSRPSPRDWERPHSEQIVKSKKKFGLMRRGNKTKFASESFYF